MSVIIPDLKIFKHKMSGILAQDKKFDINLKQIAERVNSSSTIYNSISDAYLDEQFSSDNGNPFDFKLLLSIVVLSLAVINFFTIIYVLRKIQLLSTVLVMMHGARALSKEFHFQAPTESSKDIQKEVNGPILSELEWDHAIFVICTITLVMAIVAVIYRLTTQKGAFTIITLEITNGAECVDVHVSKLPACPDFYIIQAPTSISQLAVTGALQRHHNVTWPDFTITDKALNKSILASQKLPISLYSAYKLHQILQTPFLTHIRGFRACKI